MMTDTLPYRRAELLIETAELDCRLSDPLLRIVDCTVRLAPRADGGYDIVKGEDGWARGHIPGADFIDLGEELAGAPSVSPYAMPTPDQFAEVIGRHGIGNENEVVIYSAGGIANAARLCLMFLAMGHDHVRLLNGGWEKWTGEGRAVSTDAPARVPVRYSPSVRSGQFLDKHAMKLALDDAGSCLVMALPSEVYHGRKVMFARPGRIPGSINIPASELLNADGTFLPADMLKARMAPALSADRTITYCGAGMTAAVNSFALHLLGYENAAIYDGSMLEWAADASLPMEPAD